MHYNVQDSCMSPSTWHMSSMDNPTILQLDAMFGPGSIAARASSRRPLRPSPRTGHFLLPMRRAPIDCSSAVTVYGIASLRPVSPDLLW